MRHKVKWLTFWVSMVLWFGNMWGCAAPGQEQNYKSTAPERPSQLERYDSSRGDFEKLYAEETAPSLTGIDRSNWPRIDVAPDVGTTYHGPTYFTEITGVDRDEPQVDFSQPVETQLETALAGTRDSGIYDPHHTPQLLTAPLLFGLDLLLLPVRAFQTSPFQTASTPVLPQTGAMNVATPDGTTTPRNQGNPGSPRIPATPATPGTPGTPGTSPSTPGAPAGGAAPGAGGN